MSEGGVSAKQVKAISALLVHGTIKDAAKKCGVSEATLWRWMQEDEFQREYRTAQRSVVDNAIGKLQAATDKAVDTLVKNMDSKNDFASNMAAQTVLSQSLKALELRDLMVRVEELEKRLKPQGVKTA